MTTPETRSAPHEGAPANGDDDGFSIPHPATHTNPLLEAALAYAARGWYVFPVFGDPSDPRDKSEPGKKCKAPIGAIVRHGSSDATTDPKLIHKWWSREPNANIGIATGPSGLCVCDIDSAEGEHAVEHSGELPESLEVRTGKGRHIYMQGESTSVNRVLPSVDRKSLGGYVVAPPSVHESGRVYEWSDPDIEVAPAPEWFVQAGRKKEPPAHESSTSTDSIPEGQRHGALLSWAGRFRSWGLTGPEIEAALLVVNRERCKPPSPDDEVRRIASDYGVKEVDPRKVAETQPKSDPWLSAADVAKQWDEIGDPIPTGFEPLDSWLRGGFRCGMIHAFTAGPAAGKTSLVTQLSLGLSNHLPVRWFALDEHPGLLLSRIVQHVCDVDRDTAESRMGELVARVGLDQFSFTTSDFTSINLPDDPCVVVLDSVNTAATILDGSMTEQVARIYRAARAVAAQGHVVIVMAEMNRGGFGGGRDAETRDPLTATKSGGEYQQDVQIQLRPVSNGAIQLHLTKNRFGDTAGGILRRMGVHFAYERALAAGGAEPLAALKARLLDMAREKPGLGKSALIEAAGVRKQKGLAALEILEQEGLIRLEPGERRKQHVHVTVDGPLISGSGSGN